jgi:hypothetical protein
MVRSLIALAVLLGGLLAGATIERFFVQLPAWRIAGVVDWARFSRNADLGRGKFVYPTLAFGQVLTTGAAAILLTRGQNAASMELLASAWFSTACATIGLALTALAGPNMLRAAKSNDSPGTLQPLFEGFMRWSKWRGTFQVLSFVVSIFALTLF